MRSLQLEKLSNIMIFLIQISLDLVVERSSLPLPHCNLRPVSESSVKNANHTTLVGFAQVAGALQPGS